MRLMHADLVVLDELGYLPFSQPELRRVSQRIW